jgi:probable rRNA maturation factor
MKMKPRVATASLALAHLVRAWRPAATNKLSTARFVVATRCSRSLLRGRTFATRRGDRSCWTAGRNHLHSASAHDCDRSCSGSRLFGSRAGSGNSGEIYLEDDQTALTNIDHDRLRATLTEIRKLIGYESYDVSLLLIEDEEMRETNMETRGMDDATDILSFPFHEAVKPGEIKEPDFDISEYYNLGDLLVDVPYVIRSCQEDQEAEQGEAQDEDEGEFEDEDDDDRGVSGAMATVYDPEQRIHMLLVHGMLHLVGYDHEDDDDYERMVTKEEEILKALKLMP